MEYRAASQLKRLVVMNSAAYSFAFLTIYPLVPDKILKVNFLTDSRSIYYGS